MVKAATRHMRRPDLFRSPPRDEGGQRSGTYVPKSMIMPSRGNWRVRAPGAPRGFCVTV